LHAFLFQCFSVNITKNRPGAHPLPTGRRTGKMTAADQPWVARPEPTATTSGQRGLSGVSIIISELPTDSDSDVPDLKDPGRLAADSGSHRPTQLGQHHLPAIFANLASHAAIPPAQPIAPVPYHNSNSPGLDELPSNTVCKGVPNSQRFVNPMSKLPRSELEWSSLTKVDMPVHPFALPHRHTNPSCSVECQNNIRTHFPFSAHAAQLDPLLHPADPVAILPNSVERCPQRLLPTRNAGPGRQGLGQDHPPAD